MTSSLYDSETDDSIRAKLVGYMQASGNRLSNWILGGIGRQMIEAIVPTVRTFTEIAAQAARGFGSLDTSTDPGDEDPYDETNATFAPAPGFLSDAGSNWYGTDRIGDTFASGTIRWMNTDTGAVSQTFGPDALTFQRDPAFADANGFAPTYRNQDGGPTYAVVGGGTIAANSDGTVTVGPGISIILPIQAEQPGGIGGSPASTVTIQVNALPGVTVINDATIIGNDREGAVPYRARCRIAPASVSPNGPADAYRYIATSAQQDSAGNVYYFPVTNTTTAVGIDVNGNTTSFPNASGGISLGITRAQVTNDSTIGTTAAYFATDSGSAAAVITPITNLLNAIYWPDATDRTIASAVVTSVTVSGTVKAKAGAGVSAAVIATAISVALVKAWPLIEIAGYDQVAGAGVLYADYVKGIVERAHPAIYHVVLSAPASDVPLAIGHVATLNNTIAAGNVTIV